MPDINKNSDDKISTRSGDTHNYIYNEKAKKTLSLHCIRLWNNLPKHVKDIAHSTIKNTKKYCHSVHSHLLQN